MQTIAIPLRYLFKKGFEHAKVTNCLGPDGVDRVTGADSFGAMKCVKPSARTRSRATAVVNCSARSCAHRLSSLLPVNPLQLPVRKNHRYISRCAFQALPEPCVRKTAPSGPSVSPLGGSAWGMKKPVRIPTVACVALASDWTAWAKSSGQALIKFFVRIGAQATRAYVFLNDAANGREQRRGFFHARPP